MLLNQLMEILKSLKHEVRRKYKAELRGVFGSHAREEAGEHSDIDILVEFEEGATLFDLSEMGDFLEEKLQHKVDLVCQSTVREEIRPYIYNDLVSL
ncbi:nucleotidyltransferase family protein [Desulfonema magnum]|uniref:Nucleotidyltransferase domain-containing protein n=1 Tax=Desulfonema magnum TaxID=45655 RepID=A0A975BIE8_9BACT|nr:nucleotidyltransferase family protein [Desulfonema magnum]QTA86011.1 Nucleotidyltransferase domain-containing protein [Desulfonema magnum]